MVFANFDVSSLPPAGIIAGVTAAVLIIFTALIWYRQPADEENEPDPVKRIVNPDAPARPVGSVPMPNPRNRRAAFRRDGRPVPVQIMEEDEVTEIGIGHMMDRSHTGLCFVTHFPIATGKRISIRPHQQENHAFLLVEVKHCNHKGASWEVGCKFVKQPAWSLLVDFG